MTHKFTHGDNINVTEIYFYSGGEVEFQVDGEAVTFESPHPFTVTVTKEGIACDYA